MAWHSWKACFKAIPWVMGAAALAFGCSHAWEDLEPSGGNGGSSSQTGGNGGHDSSGDGEGTASSGVTSSSTSGGGDSVTYAASVAACVNKVLLDPAACEMATGMGEMNVDENGAGDNPDISFVRFEIDGALAGKTIDTVTLELVVTSSLNAASDHSGEVWEVSPFMLSDLSMMLPSPKGAAPMSVDQGSVSQGQGIKWSLPTSIVILNSGVFLGIFPTSTNSAAYWNTTGAHPPTLTITYH